VTPFTGTISYAGYPGEILGAVLRWAGHGPAHVPLNLSKSVSFRPSQCELRRSPEKRPSNRSIVTDNWSGNPEGRTRQPRQDLESGSQLKARLGEKSAEEIHKPTMVASKIESRRSAFNSGPMSDDRNAASGPGRCQASAIPEGPHAESTRLASSIKAGLGTGSGGAMPLQVSMDSPGIDGDWCLGSGGSSGKTTGTKPREE